MRNVTFPNFGLNFDIDPVAFTIGSVQIRWYAIIISAGFILAAIYCFRRAKRFGIDLDRLTDIVLGGLVGGIIGARAYYVLFKLDYYAANPLEIFQIWNGGLAIYGGLIGAILVGWLVARWRRTKFTPVLDLAGLGFLIGQGIGRWANFVNVEAFGSNTTLPWGMSGSTITSYLSQHSGELSAYGVTVDPALPVHPTFLYESLWCLLGFAVLHFYAKHRKFDGELFLFYSMWYGVGRFFIEGLRTDSLMLGQIRVSQLLAGLIVVAALVVWLRVRSKIRRDPQTSSATLYVDTEESKDILLNGYHPEKKRKEEAIAVDADEVDRGLEAEESDEDTAFPDGGEERRLSEEQDEEEDLDTDASDESKKED